MIAPRDRDNPEEPLLDDDATPLEEVIEETLVAILVLREALPDIVLVAVVEVEFAEPTVLPIQLDDNDARELKDDLP